VGWVSMSVSGVVGRVVGFLRAGYPQGVPPTDYFPLLAVLRRRLSDEQVVQIVNKLAAHGQLPPRAADIRAEITRITNQAPSLEEVERVRRHLEDCGWPVSDDFPPRGAR
jgi:hypothetical protein